jgi:hypothetical protein
MTESIHDGRELYFKFGDVIGATVGEQALCEVPDPFIGIELGSVGRERLEAQSGKATTEVPNGDSLVRSTVVPEDDHGAPQMAEEVTEESTDLRMLDVRLGVKVVVEAKPVSSRTDRYAGNHRYFVPTVEMTVDGRQAARSPGSVDTGYQEESALVYEDDMGTQPRRVFFTRGHSFFFQRSITSSFRSRARRSGFWWLHLRRCMRRATWLR